jgi:hypothetical protein
MFGKSGHWVKLNKYILLPGSGTSSPFFKRGLQERGKAYEKNIKHIFLFPTWSYSFSRTKKTAERKNSKELYILCGES